MVLFDNTQQKELGIYISIEQASSLLGTTKQALWYTIKNGGITLYRIGRNNVLSKEDVENYKKSKQKGKKIVKKVEDWVSIDEAAEMLEVTDAGVWNAVGRGKLILYKIGKKLNALNRKEVETFKNDPIRLLKLGRKPVVISEKPIKRRKSRKV